MYGCPQWELGTYRFRHGEDGALLPNKRTADTPRCTEEELLLHTPGTKVRPDVGERSRDKDVLCHPS